MDEEGDGGGTTVCEEPPCTSDCSDKSETDGDDSDDEIRKDRYGQTMERMDRHRKQGHNRDPTSEVFFCDE